MDYALPECPICRNGRYGNLNVAKEGTIVRETYDVSLILYVTEPRESVPAISTFLHFDFPFLIK